MLWAALIFPGAGHLHLKHFRRGIALIAVTLLSMSILLLQFVRIAVQIIESTLTNAITLDIPRLATLIWQACATDPLLFYALWALALCWLVGMLDAYRLGKKTNKQ